MTEEQIAKMVEALKSARRTVAPGPKNLTYWECERLVEIIDAALAPRQ